MGAQRVTAVGGVRTATVAVGRLESRDGIDGMLAELLNLGTRTQDLVNRAHPNVNAADVSAVTTRHADNVQAIKDWATAL